MTSSLNKLLADCFKTLADGPKTGLLAARAISNTMHAAALQQPWIYDSFDECWFAKNSTISVFTMSRPTDLQKL